MKRLHYLSILAAILVAGTVLVYSRDGGDDLRPPALTATEVAALAPDEAADMRVLDHLRNRAGLEPDGWRSLPAAGQPLFATLYVEEVQRTTGWGQMALSDPGESGPPTIEEAAAAYDEFGQHEAAQATRAFALAFARHREALKTWLAGPRGPGTPAPPTDKDLERQGHQLGRFLGATRRARLDWLRQHAADLGIR